MHCFLCSSAVSLDSGGRINVSFTNIFKTLQIEQKEDTIQRICCTKCNQVTTSMSDLIDKMEKIRLELKVKLGQFGLLIKLDASKENERPDTQPDNHDDEYLKAMAKEKCLKIFSDEMQPAINLCNLNKNLLESVTEGHQEINLATSNSVAEAAATELASFYGLAGTIEAMNDEQEDEAEDLNNETGINETEPIQEQEQPSINPVDQEETSTSSSGKPEETADPIPSNNPSRSRKRRVLKKVHGTKEPIITTGGFNQLGNATRAFALKWLKEQQEDSESESEHEQSKRNQRKRPVASRDKRKKSAKKSQNSDKRTNKRRSSSNESLSEPSVSNIAKVQKRKKLIIYSDDEDEPTREPEVVEISSSDDDADGDNSIQAVVEIQVDNSDNEDAPTPEIIEIRGSAVQEPAPAILEVSSSASQEPTPEESHEQQDWLNEMFEASEVFPGYSNPTKQESEN